MLKNTKENINLNIQEHYRMIERIQRIMQNNCKELLYQMVQTGRFSEASSYTKNHIKEHQNEEYFVLFFILFRIWEEEQQAKVPTIFSSPLGHSPKTLLDHYTQIKLYLRRFEYQMPDEILEEAIKYFTANQVSPYALYHIAQFACVNLGAAFQELARMYQAGGQKEFASIFLNAAKNENNGA